MEFRLIKLRVVVDIFTVIRIRQITTHKDIRILKQTLEKKNSHGMIYACQNTIAMPSFG